MTTVGTDLFSQHRPALYRYALSLTRNPDRAEDLTQDTLYKASNAFDSYRPYQPLLAWLKQIMHNRFVSSLRWREGRDDRVNQLEGEGPYPGFRVESEPMEAFSEQRVSTRALQEALSSLDTTTRECLVMWTEGWTMKEIAEKKGFRTVVACKSRIRRGRIKLRVLLEGEHD